MKMLRPSLIVLASALAVWSIRAAAQSWTPETFPGVTIELDASAMPLLEGAPELAESGNLTGGCKRNRAYLQDKVSVDPSVRPGLVEVAFDPQTSGGLLIALPAADAPRLVADLKTNGVHAATIVGRVLDAQGVAVTLT